LAIIPDSQTASLPPLAPAHTTCLLFSNSSNSVSSGA
jgi:hypothetical protein